jgi:maltose-binding protein MalE
MRTVSSFAVVLSLALLLSACGYRERVSYTYTKQNMTQQAMLDDEKSIEKLDGVRKVMTKIDDRNTVRIEVIVDEKHERAALQYLLDQGYSQVRN